MATATRGYRTSSGNIRKRRSSALDPQLRQLAQTYTRTSTAPDNRTLAQKYAGSQGQPSRRRPSSSSKRRSLPNTVAQTNTRTPAQPTTRVNQSRRSSNATRRKSSIRALQPKIGYQVGRIMTPRPSMPPISKNEFVRQLFEAQNQRRADHGVPPLKMNQKLTAFAQQWAENLAARDAMEHRPNNDFGENIYYAAGQEIDGERPVRMWYNEIAKYSFAKAEFSPATGHFTQLIWRDSKEVGIARTKRGIKTWVVANYNPPGNVIGEFKDNVPRKKA